MKKILLILALIAISSCQYHQKVVGTWVSIDSPPRFDDFQGDEWKSIQEIALYGWFLMEPSMPSSWSNVFVLAQPRDLSNPDWNGSKFFSLFANQNNFELASIGQETLQYQPNYNSNDRGKWMFFHFSYHFGQGKVNFYMKLPSGEITANQVVKQSPSRFYRLYVGQATTGFPKFSGIIAEVFLQTGLGSYKENGFGLFTAQNPDQPLAVCPLAYSECNYGGQEFRLCENKPYSVGDVKSILIPAKYQVKFTNPKNTNQKVTYTVSQPCITQHNWSLLLSEKQISSSKKTVLKKQKSSRN